MAGGTAGFAAAASCGRSVLSEEQAASASAITSNMGHMGVCVIVVLVRTAQMRGSVASVR
ncbi:hypothetical protein GCM10027431_00630 [Lysobacter rhizosphaerae]